MTLNRTGRAIALVLALVPLCASAITPEKAKSSSTRSRTRISLRTSIRSSLRLRGSRGKTGRSISSSLGSKSSGSAESPARVPVFTDVMHAIEQAKGENGQVGVVAFMKILASGKSVETPSGTLDLAAFKTIWEGNKTESKRIEQLFRNVRKDDHEWIPSNMMLEVIERASTATEAQQWIDLQDRMRTATSQIIFKPSKVKVIENGKYVLQGHVGALVRKSNGFALDDQMGPFHDELRAAFRSSDNIQDCAKAVKKVFEEWVWDGSPLDLPVSPDVYYKAGGSVARDKNMLKTQRDNYAAITKMLDTIIKKGVAGLT